MNPKNIIIQEFIKDDFDSVSNLLQEVSIYKPLQEKKHIISQEFINDNNSYAIVAKYHKQIIGFGSIFFFERIRGGKCAYLEDIVVEKSFRNLKVGTLIINTLIDYAISKECFKITLETNEKNESFYAKLDFKNNGISMRRLLIY